MGRINITLRDDLEKQFRETVAQRLGFKKGNLQIAIEEAIEQWIKNPVVEELKKIKKE